ncbi:hypothetical protein [Duganella vulcania]|uniref:Uncharacterized protein n=1 Tax=Duganella vulcania TaxID=2692166 RepID=A0A845GI60_9BURK|nr:hypothetical protein [Duganella vulcania]MYM92359.1 hypothetical protein [Duganella vulcania]
MEMTTTQHQFASRGMKPLSVIAEGRAHGDRIRYLAGCRCEQCRAANAAYAKSRKQAQSAGDWNGIVSAERARQHLKDLSSKGVGRRSVSAACDVAEPIIGEILNGRKLRIRARTERTILAVTQAAASDRSLVPAAAAWAMINELLDVGYTKRQLALALGLKNGALQLSKTRVTVRSDYEVRRLHERLLPALKAPTEQKAQPLSSDQVLQQANETTRYWNGIVSAEPVLQHLQHLSNKGVHLRVISQACDVAEQILRKILSGRQKHVRAETERMILSLTESALSTHILVPANRARALVNRLLKAGYSKAQLAQALGQKSASLQLNQPCITARLDTEIGQLYERLRPVSSARALQQLKQLSQEGYTRTQVRQRAQDLARSLGVHDDDLSISGPKIANEKAEFIGKLHAQMTD